MGITIDCGPIKTEVKHLFGGVVRAMMSPDGSIVASLKNINGFQAVNTPPDDLIHTDFKQEGVVPKVMLHIFEEFALLLGRHPFNNKVPHVVVCKVSKPWATIEAGMTEKTTDILDGSGMRNTVHGALRNVRAHDFPYSKWLA
nr:hypothetical protein [Tanacetum cinerariifolium]